MSDQSASRVLPTLARSSPLTHKLTTKTCPPPLTIHCSVPEPSSSRSFRSMLVLVRNARTDSGASSVRVTVCANLARRPQKASRQAARRVEAAIRAHENGLSLLESGAVKEDTSTDYSCRLKAFEQWNRRGGTRVDYNNPADLQNQLLDYFDEQFVAGKTADEGNKLVSALGHFHPKYYKAVQNRFLQDPWRNHFRQALRKLGQTAKTLSFSKELSPELLRYLQKCS